MQENNTLVNYFCLENDLGILEKYLHLSRKKEFKKGSSVFPLGKKVSCLHYLKSGCVGRLITAENGTEKYIKMVSAKSIFGEVLFFAQHINEQRFVAVENCECYLFEKETVYNTLLKDEYVVYALIQWFCARMHSLNIQISEALVKDPHYRICKFLNDYVEIFGSKDDAGQYIYEGKLSHYDIAKYLGINRVSVTNIMKKLQEDGVIQKDRTKLIVKNKKYLELL